MEVQANGDSGRIPDGPTNPMVMPLLTDLYQFTMAYAYWKSGKRAAVFGRILKYTIFAGLDECIRLIANFKFTEEEINLIRETLPNCEDGFCDFLRRLDCSEVEVYVVPEGSVVRRI